MKIKFILFLFLIINSTILYSQDLAALDNKKGYMDIKIGQSISLIAEKVEKDIKVDNMYLIKDTKEYFIDGHVIDKIIILVSEDDNKTIVNISLMFIDKIKGLIEKANDTRENTEKRIEAFEEAKRLNEKGSEYEFYNNLFKDAFGKPKTNEKGVESWEGKKVILATVNSPDFGMFTFAKVNSEEYNKAKKLEKGKKATSKF